MKTFTFTLQEAYFNGGFFNVRVAHECYFPILGGPLTIYCGNEKLPIEGKFDRVTNTNNTPRIKGGVPLREWFQKNYDVLETITVYVINDNTIALE
jgi:hypothetical protein